MNLYRFDRDLQILERGPCECGAALRVYEECCENGLKSFDSAEDAMAATSFGLCRSPEDFIELSCHGLNTVTAHSDRLHYPSRLRKMFDSKHHLFIKGDRAKGQEVIEDFFGLARQEFEAKYADALCR